MRKALVLVRQDVPYRSDALVEGLRRHGYAARLNDRVTQDYSLIVTWNRYGSNDQLCRSFEAKNVPILVIENGYMGRDAPGGPWYAMAWGQHNGAGRWPTGGPTRWAEQGWPLLPYRPGGRVALLLPQRGIGPAGVAMPKDWQARTEKRLRDWGVPFRVRRHPGERPCKPLAEDLADAFCTVTWGSGASLKALTMGVPCVAEFPRWIGRLAAAPMERESFTNLNTSEEKREEMLSRVGWAQWRLDEIKSGAAFGHLLNGECV